MSLISSRSVLAPALAVGLLCVPVAAQPSQPSAPQPPQTADVVVSAKSQAPELQATAIEAAIRAELDESKEPIEAGTKLVIHVGPARVARVEVHASSGELRTRELALPAEPKSALEVLALVSASLVRSDADALAAALRAAKAPPPSEAGADANAAGAPSSDAATWTNGADPSAPNADATGTGATANKVPAASATAVPDAKAPQKSAAEPAAKATTKPAAEDGTAPKPAAEPALESAPANLSFVHPLAILPNSDEKDLRVELGIFYSHVGALDGVGINGLVLRSNQRARGLLVAGVWSEVGGSGSGLNAAGLLSLGGGAFQGLSASGLVDRREGAFTGLQAGGLWSSSEGMLGLQAGGLMAMSHELQGVQAGGLAAYAHDVLGLQVGGVGALGSDVTGLQTGGVAAMGHGVEGLQAGGVFASANDVLGLQAGGVASIADDTRGIGVAGLVSLSRDTEGARIAPINVGRDIEGAQIGIVNVGHHVSGTQIGVINVADRVDGFPIGLVNAVGNGRNQALAWYEGQSMPLNVGYRYLHSPDSTVSVYTLLSFGMKPGTDGADDTFAPGGSVGLRAAPFGPNGRLFAEGDLSWRNETTFRENADSIQSAGARFALGAQATPWLAFFVGVAPRITIEEDGTVSAPEPLDLPMAGVQVL